MSENFDTNLFAFHKLPFASYAEPDGYERLSAVSAPQQRHYDAFVPQTVAASRGLLAAVVQRDEWGQQYVDRLPDGTEEGRWRTENVAHTYPTRGDHERRGNSLEERTLLRSLTRTGRESKRGGNDIFALGRTDKHLRELETGLWGSGVFRTTPVAVLLLDIDMDAAWEQPDIAAVRRELTIEREIAAALGLPYRTFRTGGRGHQIVLPLPAPVDRSAAGWLLDAYVEVLRPFHFQSGGAAKADRHNLSGLVRIAGGRHATTDRVAFWIDPDDVSLFPIVQQIEMMQTGYSHPPIDPREAEAFAEAAAEIASFLEREGMVQPHEYLSGATERARAFAAVEQGLPDNLLIERFRSAQERFALSDEDTDWEAVNVEGGLDALEAAMRLADPRDEQGNPVSTRQASAAEGSRAWAERVWDEDWPATGAFWLWISEGGRRGITAAKLLFGEERAEQELLARVDSHLISRTLPGKARERKRVIAALYRKHKMTGFGVARRLAGVVLPEAAVVLVPVILERLHAVKPIQPRNRDDIEQLVVALLIAFTADAANERRGVVDLSLDDLVSVVRSRWPVTDVNRDQIRRYLRRLTDGTEECGFSLIARVGDNRGWTKAAHYRPGPDLRVTEWGRSLPVDTHHPQPLAPLRVEPLRYRVQGGTHVFEAPKKRGRRPRGGSADPGEAV